MGKFYLVEDTFKDPIIYDFQGYPVFMFYGESKRLWEYAREVTSALNGDATTIHGHYPDMQEISSHHFELTKKAHVIYTPSNYPLVQKLQEEMARRFLRVNFHIETVRASNLGILMMKDAIAFGVSFPGKYTEIKEDLSDTIRVVNTCMEFKFHRPRYLERLYEAQRRYRKYAEMRDRELRQYKWELSRAEKAIHNLRELYSEKLQSLDEQ